ncbi:MAG: D-alanine--D-alanine ligase [Rickettsiales bacterium]
MKNKKIAVLCGGWNSESEVSMRSGSGVFDALINLGYDAVKINFTRNIYQDLMTHKVDLVFNALHGKFGEDGKIQGLLDILDIPYTHSGLLASAICMDKVLTRKICSQSNILSPKYEILRQNEQQDNLEKIQQFEKPFVIKPISEGSSVGVEVIMPNHKFNISDYNWQYGNELILEKYIAGQEIHVGIMNGKALGAIEVRPHGLFYDYNCKYTRGMSDYIMPAEISEEKYEEVLKLAEICYETVGCRGVARVDFILNNKKIEDFEPDNQFYLLEVNTHPGFTPTSLLPKIAKYVGISFEEIVEFLIDNAKCG